MNKTLKAKLKKIRMLVLDVDGVLTNGSINIDHRGEEFKAFNVMDGFGIVMFRSTGYKVAIISARAAPAVVARAKDLKIDKIFQDAHPKTKAFQKLLKQFELKRSEVCFMGDDLPDIGVLKMAGFPVAVKNAASEVKDQALYITKNCGGQGAVREVIEMILKEQGLWKKVLNQYSSY